MKTFKSDFDLLKQKLLSGENFAFSRFSDGEEIILNNEILRLDHKGTLCGSIQYGVIYPENDHKEFNPEYHTKTRELLLQAIQYQAPNYYKGIVCPCCVGFERTKVMRSLCPNLTDDYLTWSNLWINSNYPRFITEIVPLFRERDIRLVVNSKANTINLATKNYPSPIYPVGPNCIVNDLDLVDTIRQDIITYSLTDVVFLFGASSLSNILIYQLYKEFPNNTYLDIGTALHKHLGMELQRSYLRGYWLGESSDFFNRTCTWPV